jgi:hypothetical protein
MTRMKANRSYSKKVHICTSPDFFGNGLGKPQNAQSLTGADGALYGEYERFALIRVIRVQLFQSVPVE